MPQLHTSAGPLSYRERGVGRPIVFVHGLLVDGTLWDPVVDLLCDRFRCITPDWPLGSHPIPMREDADLSPHGVARLVAEVLERLDLDDVVLVANDSGGAITQLVLTNERRRIGGAVLTTCDAFEVFPPPLFAYLSWLGRTPRLLHASGALLRAVPALQRMPTAYGRLTKRPLARALVERWLGPTRDRAIGRDLAKFLRGVSADVTLEAAKKLGAIDVPVLVAWANEDPSFPTSLGERLAAAIPNAKLELVEDAWVFASLDRPDRVAELVGDFAA
jgi:pimeloyl-ACP methyl ester carboxylesterase